MPKSSCFHPTAQILLEEKILIFTILQTENLRQGGGGVADGAETPQKLCQMSWANEIHGAAVGFFPEFQQDHWPEKSSTSTCDWGLSLLSELSPSWARQGMREGCGEDHEEVVV